MAYLKRIIDAELLDRLSSSGAVVIEGPKACGKTASALQVAASSVLMDLDAAARASVDIDPRLPLAGPTPRLIDEWQLAPAVWNGIRREVDARKAPGQFILTGSATPADDANRHTGAGRFAHLRMRTMSLFETGASNGTLSLAALLRGETDSVPDPGLAFTELVDLLCRGGWPAHLGLALPAALRAVRDYLRDICRADIHLVDGIRRDPVRVQAVIEALARHIATDVSYATIAADVAQLPGTPNVETVAAYINALERLMLAEPQPAWAPHLRSRSRVRGTRKFHFVDPSLAVAALGAGPEQLLADLNATGLLFESLVVRDLRIYSQALGADVRHYRDNTGLEIDAIVTAANARWLACEIKLGSAPHILDAAAAQLLKFAQRVDTTRCGEPAALLVITAGGYGYRRPDGVSVVPIACLGP
jgi:predicted AAA+ superfamily ATPase